MFTRQQVAGLIDVKSELDKAGATLVGIGSGTPEQARKFMEHSNFPGEMYVDPSLSVYKAFGLERGIWKTFGPGSVARGIKALSQGFRQGTSSGDLWQQGGIFVLGPGRQLLFQHRDPAAGKKADLKAVLAAAAR
jgi:hypothetical protein